MTSQRLEDLIRSVAEALSRANRELTVAGDGPRYAVSELEISAPLARLSVNDDVLIDAEPEEGVEAVSDRFVRFRVVPLPREEEAPEAEVPELKKSRVEDAIERLLSAGFRHDRIRVAFDPESDAEKGTITSYRLTEARGGLSPEIVLSVAGPPPDREKGAVPGKDARRERESARGAEAGRTYRRREDSETWHFCRNCSNDPDAGFTTSEDEPESGQICRECRAKTERGECD